jgi:hemoglobin-like flavoprotein
MTSDQKRRIRESFEAIQEISGPVAMLFYGRLFEMEPGARKLFHNDLAAQGKKLMDMLGSVVESLDHFEAMTVRLEELGRKHAEFGVRPEHYDTLSLALLWALAQAVGPDFDSKTREAWRTAIGAINTAMKKGAMA